VALIEITGRRMNGGEGHEHVVEVRAENRAGQVVYARPEEVMRWLDDNTNVAFVYTADRRSRFIVGVFKTLQGVRALRTYTQDAWRDHLLDLPEYDDHDAAAPRLVVHARVAPERVATRA
jgi:hypothetical protein